MIDLRLLGTTAIRNGNRPDFPRVLVQPKRLALFTYLIHAAPRGFHRRDKLFALFWPDHSEAEARAALNDAVYFLRRRLGRQVVVSRGHEELGVAAERVRCDVVEFERALEGEDYAQAVVLYGGELLDGFHLAGSEEFEHWLEAERARLRAGYARALAALAEAQERGGESEAAFESWRRLCALDPYDSHNVLRFIESLARGGRAAVALREAEKHAGLLQSELGVGPPEELQEFTERLRTEHVPAEPAAPVVVGSAGELPPRPSQEVAAAGDGAGEEVLRRHATAAARPSRPSTAPGADRPAERSGRGGTHFLLGRQQQRRLLLGGAAALLVLAAGAHLGWRGTQRADETQLGAGLVEGAAERSVTAVAVLPFTVRGSPDLVYLREGVASLLASKLDGVGELRSVDPHTLLRLAAGQDEWGPEQAAGLAAHFGARHYVLGNAVEDGAGRLHLDASLYEAAAAEPSVRAVVEGAGTELFALVDQLAVELLATRLRQPGAEFRRAADLTTHSLPALRAFLDGERKRRAFDTNAATEAYQRALREDSTFALAHLRLSTAAGWQPRHFSLRLPALEAALRHRERLSPRDRLLLEAHAAGVRGGGNVEAHFRDLTLRYPNDAEVWFLYGDLLFHANPDRGRPVSEAREAFERAVALDPSNREFLVHLKDVARHERRFADAAGLAERMYEHDARFAQRWAMVTLLDRTASEDPSERAAARAALPSLDPVPQLQMLAWTACHGPAELLEALLDLRAERVFERDPGPAQGPDFWPLAEAARQALWLGRLSDGRASLDGLRRRSPNQAVLYEAWWTHPPVVAASTADLMRLRTELEALPPDHSPWPRWEADVWRQVRLFLLGILSVRLEDFPAASRYAGTLEALPAPDLHASHGYGADVFESWAHVGSQTVRAMAARAQGQAREALQLLESVEPEMFGFPLWMRPGLFPDFRLQRFLRAELLRELGRDEEALAWYPYYDPNMWLTGALFVPLSHLRVAEIHDRRGAREAAIHHYTLFTLLWREADPELRPLVDQAGQRLAALERARPSPR